jgi:monoamine oxidase
MAHGIYRKLHRRYGPRLSGVQRVKRALDKQAEFSAWQRATIQQADCGNLLPRGVAVVGAGCAGLAAAHTLGQRNIRTTVFEARKVIGGRVESDRKLIPGRVIEAGAELIGFNHPSWITFARQFGLGLTVLTTEDQYAAMQLEMPLRIKGKAVTDREKLYRQMTFVLQQISNDARVVVDPFAPWNTPGAAALDRISVAARIAAFVRKMPGQPHPDLVDALEMQLGNDNVLPTKEQSYLGLLALVAGGRFSKDDADLSGYWTSTEDCRCSEGNDRLFVMLHEYGKFRLQTSSPVMKIDINETGGFVKVTWLDVARATLRTQDFDYVILTVPPSVLKKITITPPLPAGMEMAMGPAVKYLSRVPGRFWIKRGLAPSGLADDIGQTWESTENQTLEAQGIGLSVFAGGTLVPKSNGAKHFRDRLPTLYPGFKPLAERYVDWSSVPFIENGYVCPRVGEVTTIAKFLSTPHHQRLFFGGEHACMAFFGYMEGALQSGMSAAAAVVKRCVREKVAVPQRERLRHEYQRAEAVESLPMAVGQGWQSLPPRWPIESDAEEPDPAPKSVVIIAHQHVERTCSDGKTWTNAASVSAMSPTTMNPGFINADDTLRLDAGLDAKLTRLILDTPKYATMVSAESRKTRTAHNDDRLRVAVLDLTGDKICNPGLAAWGPTFHLPGASTAKVLVVFAVHQLLFDLNQLATAGAIATSADLVAAAAAFWKGFTCPPDLGWLVNIDASGPVVTVSRSANLSKHLNEMVTRSFSGISTTRAAELIVRIGFEYLASLALQSGLRHPTRGGVFYGRAYKNATVKMKLNRICHKGINPIVWATNPLGAMGIVLTALSAATFMTLLAQRRLVTDTASTEIEALLNGGCGFVNVPGVTRRATKCGLTKVLRHDAVLMEGSRRRYALAFLSSNASWRDRGAFIADVDRLIRDNNP